MPGHPLIEAYLRTLRRELPADVVDELTDGLLETWESHPHRTPDPDGAARAAIAAFGDARDITDAFTRVGPGRRAARLLLATGPLVGACWATALLSPHAGLQVPVPVRLGFGGGLVLLVLTLLVATRGSYRTARRAAVMGGAGCALLDAAAISAVLLTAAPATWAVRAAVVASLGRMCLTARALPRLTHG